MSPADIAQHRNYWVQRDSLHFKLDPYLLSCWYSLGTKVQDEIIEDLLMDSIDFQTATVRIQEGE